MSAHFTVATQVHLHAKMIRDLRQSEYREYRLRRARSVLRLEKALEIKNKKNLYTNTVKDLLMRLGKTSLCQDPIPAPPEEEFDFSEERDDQVRKPFTWDKLPKKKLWEDGDRWVWDGTGEDANPVCYYDEEDQAYVVAPGSDELIA